jgi:hypothetical protein
MSKEVGPKRQIGLDSFNRDIVRVFFGGCSCRIVEPDKVLNAGGGLNVSVS